MPIIVRGEIKEQPLCSEECPTTYGVYLYADDGTRYCLPDVDVCAQRAQRFLNGVIGEELDKTQLWYLLEDFLAQEYDGTRSR
jgi:hypothetical protein